ncbi:hypothetical protein PENTCL1PPCAC_25577, partial [Pristionchus entomophagus]
DFQFSDDKPHSNASTRIFSKGAVNVFAILFVLLISTFLAAQVITNLINNHKDTVSPEHPVYRKNLSVLTGVFRFPIGGRLNCSQRVLEPSPISPTDANRVRPADVQFIAAMGDSYATAFLSYTDNTEEVDDLRNAVGNSFIMGGDGELESHLTLANVFRQLNPSLAGISIGKGLNEEQTNLNVAIPGMWVNDMQRQARELIRRFQKHPTHSTSNGWKLIHIFVGTKDISGFCVGQKGSTKMEYKTNLTEAIELLQDALPKTIISIIGMTNLDFMWRAPTLIKQLRIPCEIDNFELLAQRRVEEYREAIIEIVSESQTISRKDQAVIAQHIFDDLWAPLTKSDGSFNADFYAVDSFHLSNYGNSLVAKQLWNHLVSPDYRKITTNEMMADESPELICPETSCPYIRTSSNSVFCQ